MKRDSDRSREEIAYRLVTCEQPDGGKEEENICSCRHRCVNPLHMGLGLVKPYTTRSPVV
jgi:hypothetical protein